MSTANDVLTYRNGIYTERVHNARLLIASKAAVFAPPAGQKDRAATLVPMLTMYGYTLGMPPNTFVFIWHRPGPTGHRHFIVVAHSASGSSQLTINSTYVSNRRDTRSQPRRLIRRHIAPLNNTWRFFRHRCYAPNTTSPLPNNPRAKPHLLPPPCFPPSGHRPRPVYHNIDIHKPVYSTQVYHPVSPGFFLSFPPTSGSCCLRQAGLGRVLADF